MSIFEIIICAFFGFIAGTIYGIASKEKKSRRITHDIDQKTWERIEGWRK